MASSVTDWKMLIQILNKQEIESKNEFISKIIINLYFA